MWQLYSVLFVFTQASDSPCFQPHSNKAEKFDYVSNVPPVFYSVQTMNIKMQAYYFGAQRYAEKAQMFFFQVMEFVKKMAGQEYVGFSNAT